MPPLVLGMNTKLVSIMLGFVSGASLGFGESGSFHTVKEGETLWGIAQRNGIEVATLKDWNALRSDVIHPGQSLSLALRVDEEPLEEVEHKTLTDSGEVEDTEEQVPDILRRQVLLDRAGFAPGKIDGLDGRFTRLALSLCEQWNPTALDADSPTVVTARIPQGFVRYIDGSLPGSGASPDFKALTQEKQVMSYYTTTEYLSERFHCSAALLAKLNPTLNLEAMKAGDALQVPNVVPFEIERYFTAKGEGIWSNLVGSGKKGRVVHVAKEELVLTLWEEGKMIRAFPITLNPEKTPTGTRAAEIIAPGPVYSRKKTSLDLKPGPNSPVGILWVRLGNGYGLHGTHNPDSIGRSVSSGCIRLANWDAVRLAGMIRKGGEIVIADSEARSLAER